MLLLGGAWGEGLRGRADTRCEGSGGWFGWGQRGNIHGNDQYLSGIERVWGYQIIDLDDLSLCRTEFGGDQTKVITGCHCVIDPSAGGQIGWYRGCSRKSLIWIRHDDRLSWCDQAGVNEIVDRHQNDNIYPKLLCNH